MQIEKCKMKIENRGLWSLVLGLRALVLEQSPKTKDQKPKTRWPNLQFSIFNFHFLISFLALCSLLFALCAAAQAQTIPDKMVASVTNGSRATPDLIT